MARKSGALQQATPINAVNQSPSPHLRRQSPSPKPPPAGVLHGQQGCTKDRYQWQKCPPTPLWSSSPSLTHSPPASLSQRSPSPSMSLAHPHSSSSPRPQFLPSKNDPSKNENNNNNHVNLPGVTISTGRKTNSYSINFAVSNGEWSVNQEKMPPANRNPDPLWSGSHNRVAQPFSASAPGSRVQSPSPSPILPSLTRLRSPPPQHNYSSPMANKPPHPRSTQGPGASSHNPLGLTLELPRASSVNSACLSPWILSPPPIGVSLNVWANNVAAPQPRNPRCASSSPSPSLSSSLGSPTLEAASFPNSSSSLVPLRNSRASSPSSPSPPASQATSQILHRSFSCSLADTSSSPAQSNPSGLRRSWGDSGHRSFGFNRGGRGSFEQQKSCPTSPRNGWSSYGSSPSCLSPLAGLQSPVSPTRLPQGNSILGGQHFTSVPWPDVRELSNKYNRTDSLGTSSSPTVIASSPPPFTSLSHTLPASSPSPSDNQTDWGDPDLKEGSCRSQLICAYVAQPRQDQTLSASCMSSPPFAPYHHHNYQSQVKPQPQVQIATTTPASPLPFSSSPPSFGQSTPSKQRNHKSSYATTVNLQIAGSGRITSFSTAQVSLTQTLQGGAGAGGPGQGQAIRRVSINGLSHLPSPLPQSCNRL